MKATLIRPRRPAFTLIELLVVIAIIAILILAGSCRPLESASCGTSQ